MKYLITVVQKVPYVALVEADSVDDAEAKAEAAWDARNDEFTELFDMTHEVAHAAEATDAEVKRFNLMTDDRR